MSTHSATIYRVKLYPHPDAEALSLMDIGNGNFLVLRTTDWTDGELLVHIEPDYEVDTNHPAFNWVTVKDKDGNPKRRWERIKPAKLRGVVSWGIGVPAVELPELEAADLWVGNDVLPKLPVRRWEPPGETTLGGDVASPPAVVAPTYDIEGYFKYCQHFQEGEPVVAHEKLHGSNSRFVWTGTEFNCGSRTQWKKENPNDAWWRALENTPGLKEFLKAHPGWVVYGEVYGLNPGFRYGVERGDRVQMAAFDILRPGKYSPEWIDWEELQPHMSKVEVQQGSEYLLSMDGTTIPWAPVIYEGAYFLDSMKELAEGRTTMVGAKPADIREGIVVRPWKERKFDVTERLILKFVSNTYLER